MKMLTTYEPQMATPDTPTREPYLPLLPRTGLETLKSYCMRTRLQWHWNMYKSG